MNPTEEIHMRIPDRRKAEEGERFTLDGREITVAPKEDGDRGRWFCISCVETLANNMAKDHHCMGPRKRGSASAPGGKDGSGARARHVLAWFSYASQEFEVP
jgi:hypothetical protein